MQKRSDPIRAVSVILMVAYLQMLFLPLSAVGGTNNCGYDPANPSADNARKNFLALNYDCAEMELNDILKDETLNTEMRANVHVLLAEVYYAKVRNTNEKRGKVIEQFVAAFDAYRHWKGELNIKSSDFMGMMKEAQEIVDKKDAEEAVPVEPTDKPIAETETDDKPAEIIAPTTITTTASVSSGEKKPFYKQWWAYAIGIGVVAGAVVLLGGGDDGGGEPVVVDTLPYFPDPPTAKSSNN